MRDDGKWSKLRCEACFAYLPDSMCLGLLYYDFAFSAAGYTVSNQVHASCHTDMNVLWLCLLQAIKEDRKRFNFLGQDIRLIPSCAICVTMNPGYAGE